jgi:hypothetical protein
MQNSTRVHSTAHVHSTSELIPPHYAPCMQVLRTAPASPATGTHMSTETFRPGRSDGARWSQMEPDGARWSQIEPHGATPHHFLRAIARSVV